MQGRGNVNHVVRIQEQMTSLVFIPGNNVRCKVRAAFGCVLARMTARSAEEKDSVIF